MSPESYLISNEFSNNGKRHTNQINNFLNHSSLSPANSLGGSISPTTVQINVKPNEPKGL